MIAEDTGATIIGLGTSFGLSLLLCSALCLLLWTYRRRVRCVEAELEIFLQEEPTGTREWPCQNCIRRVEVPAKDIVRVFELNGQELVEVEEERVTQGSIPKSQPSSEKEDVRVNH